MNLYLGNLDEALQLARVSGSGEDLVDGGGRCPCADAVGERISPKGDIDDALEQAGIALLAHKSHDNFVGRPLRTTAGEAFRES